MGVTENVGYFSMQNETYFNFLCGKQCVYCAVRDGAVGVINVEFRLQRSNVPRIKSCL